MHFPLIANLLPSLLSLSSPQPDPSRSLPISPRTLTFQPIHAYTHTTFNSSTRPSLLLHNATTPTSYLNIPDLGSLQSLDEDNAYLIDNPAPHIASSPLTIRTTPIIVRRPRIRPPSILSWALSARNERYTSGNTSDNWLAPDYADVDGDWEDVEVMGPDVTDRQTLLALAKISSNAYVTPDGGEWWPVEGLNQTLPFGWEADSDGLRGHVFADPTNSTVIISIKGTSAGVFGVGGPTAKNDKFNDNLLFSCCCGRVDFSWTPVCDCYAGGYKCEQTCLEDSLVADSVYATVGTNLYNNVTYMYPNSTIWLVGHSLGGSVSSLIGLSFGAPVLTFEAPGERLAAQRLHLPLPPGMPSDKTGITHVFHSADPIPQGACTGAYSGCYAAGFALESKCHTGKTIFYDTVTVKGWAVDVRTHRIGELINKILVDPWPGTDEDPDEVEMTRTKWSWWGWGRKGTGKGKGGEDHGGDDDGWEKHGGVPKAQTDEDCIDCFKWEYGDGWSKKTFE